MQVTNVEELNMPAYSAVSIGPSAICFTIEPLDIAESEIRQVNPLSANHNCSQQHFYFILYFFL